MVGIVSRGDLIHALAWVFGAQEYQAILDADLKRRIVAALERDVAVPPGSVKISVRNGEVELRGTLAGIGLTEAMKREIADIPGVEAIHDHLGRTEPGERNPKLEEPRQAGQLGQQVK
jgi:hypothetical protein